MSNSLVIYHAGCNDGFGAAWCFWSKYKDTFSYFPGVYNTLPPNVEGKDVYLLDFSYSREVTQDLISKANRVVILDHHKTSIDDLSDLPGLESFSSLSNSGVILAWSYLYPYSPPPPLLLHIEDRDLWKFSFPATRLIVAALSLYPKDFSVWDNLVLESTLPILLQEGKIVSSKIQRDVESTLKYCVREMSIGSYIVPVANTLNFLSSDVAHSLCDGHPFAACYFDSKDYREFSLRSGGPLAIDVSSIAKLYGGGGHVRASGFKVPRDHILAKS